MAKPMEDSIIETSTKLALAGASALGERREDPDHAPEPAAHVGELEAGRLRRSVRRALEAEDPGAREVVDVVPRAQRERPRLAVAGERADHEAWVLREERLVREAEPVHHAGTELLEHHVVVSDHLRRRPARSGFFRSMHALRLLRLSARKIPDWSPICGGMWRR